MGLFGSLDVNEIPEDPFWVDNGKYFAVLQSWKKADNEEKNTHGLVMRWQIQEPDSDFDGSFVDDWKTTYPGLTEEQLEDMEQETKNNCKKDLSRLRQRLTQVGVSVEDMEDDNFGDEGDELSAQYVGTEAYITVRNTPDKNVPSRNYRNITFVELATPADDD